MNGAEMMPLGMQTVVRDRGGITTHVLASNRGVVCVATADKRPGPLVKRHTLPQLLTGSSPTMRYRGGVCEGMGG